MNRFRNIVAVSLGKIWAVRLRFIEGATFPRTLRVIGRPRIRTVPGTYLTVGERTTLNSYARGYHAAMHSPVTLILDQLGARIRIGADTRINGALIHAQDSISIGSRVLIAAQTVIIDSNGHVMSPAHERTTRRDSPRPVVIENDVWIGLGVVILPGAHIGHGSVIGANVVVGGTVPPNSIVRSEHSTTRIYPG